MVSIHNFTYPYLSDEKCKVYFQIQTKTRNTETVWWTQLKAAKVFHFKGLTHTHTGPYRYRNRRGRKVGVKLRSYFAPLAATSSNCCSFCRTVNSAGSLLDFSLQTDLELSLALSARIWVAVLFH